MVILGKAIFLNNSNRGKSGQSPLNWGYVIFQNPLFDRFSETKKSGIAFSKLLRRLSFKIISLRRSSQAGKPVCRVC